MSPEVERIFNEVLALPPAEREEFLCRLLESLGPEPQYTEEEFNAELDRRYAEIEAGTAEWIPAEEAIAELRREFGLSASKPEGGSV